jgi:predicted RNase H-like HicB family nuclease
MLNSRARLARLVEAREIMRKKHLNQFQESSFDLSLTLTATIQREGEWYLAFCPEFPEANGQGHTAEESLQSLKEAVLLLIEDRREDAQRASAGNGRLLKSA